MTLQKPFIIAIDGTAASGKGTLARRLAAEYDFAYLDTGKLYRLVGWNVLQQGGNASDPKDAARVVVALKDSITPTMLDDENLLCDAAGVAASQVGAVPEVRAALLDLQRNFATPPPEGKRGAVLDGRDIGTVICPDAPVKFYVTADVETRAQRRFKELQSRGVPKKYDDILRDLKERDERDSNRADAPLKQAPDAFFIDSTQMTIADVMNAAMGWLKSFSLPCHTGR